MSVKRRVWVEVTEEHIRRGERGHGGGCPIALALADRFPGGDWWVGKDSVRSREVRGSLSERARRFVTCYDRPSLEPVEGVVMPFSFEIELVYGGDGGE